HFRGTISVIDAPTNKVVAVVKGAREPGPVAVSPDGKRLYVADQTSPHSRFLTIDTATNRIISSLNIGQIATTLALSPDGARAYVGLLNTRTLLVIDPAADQLIA